MFNCFSPPPEGPAPAFQGQGQSPSGQLDSLYGFPEATGLLTQAQIADRQQSARAATSRVSAWSRLGANKDGMPQLPAKRSQLKELCRGGIPFLVRRQVWPEIVGATQLRRAKGAGYYEQMLQQAGRVDISDAQDSRLLKAIKQIDLVRCSMCVLQS